MSVIIPLILLANASGMSKRLGFIFALIAMLTTIGIMIATVPVLLTNAPMNEVTAITSTNRRVSLLPARRISLELIIFASPVWNMAPPTTKSPTIMITDVLEKPENASCGVGSRIPSIMSSASAHNATMSDRILPEMKNTIVNSRVAKVPTASRCSEKNVCIYLILYIKVCKVSKIMCRMCVFIVQNEYIRVNFLCAVLCCTVFVKTDNRKTY